MKTFNIDVEVIESATCEAGMASISVKVSVTEDTTPGKVFSRLHMSEKTLRLMHQALDKLVRGIDTGVASVTTHPALPPGAGPKN